MRLAPLLTALSLSACPAELPAPPSPGPLQVGLSRVAMPAPVGIGTVGNGSFGVKSDPSPFAEIFPATNAVHGPPNLKAVVISRGDGFEAVLLRSDTVGVFQHMRQGLRRELEQRLGKDLDDALILGGTHTHGGPGRVIDREGPFELIADRFHAEHYERMLDAMADAVELAYQDLQPARLGRTEAFIADGHNDRRCEDGLEYTNDSTPTLLVERDGRIDAVVIAYAVHGTTVGIDELTLTADVSGAIEERIEADFEHPVMAVMFNSWGADNSPGNPSVPVRDDASFLQGNYRQQEAVAYVVSEGVREAMGAASWDEEPDIRLRTRRFAVNREILGYDDQTFPYHYGGVFCGAGIESDCDPETDMREIGIDEMCVPFNENYAVPQQTVVTAGHIGDSPPGDVPG